MVTDHSVVRGGGGGGLGGRGKRGRWGTSVTVSTTKIKKKIKYKKYFTACKATLYLLSTSSKLTEFLQVSC